MLIGRDAERERLRAVVAEATHGRSAAVVVVGEPGVGKTALVEDAVGAARSFRVVRATGYEAEADLAFAGVAAILAGFHDLIPGLPEPQRQAIAGALGLGPPLPPGDRFTAYVGTLNLLAAAADAGPLLVVVDDAHWLDAASLDALAFAARRVAGEGIAIVLAARREPPAMTARSAGIETLRLGGLPAADAVRLVHARAPTPVSGAVAARLAELSSGNPLALLDAVVALSADQLTGRTPLPELLPVGEGLARAFMARAERLPEATRRALVIAAAGAGDPTLVADALRATGLSGALHAAELAGLITLGPGGVRFPHPLIRTGAYRGATADERRDTHLLLADAATARGEAGVFARAHHAAEAATGPDEATAALLERAGRHAASRLGYAEAAGLLNRSAALSTTPGRRAPRLVEAGTLAMMAGQPELARRTLDQAVSDADDPRVAFAARAARAQVMMWRGQVDEARVSLMDLAAQVEESAPDVAAKMYVDATLSCAMGAQGAVMRQAAAAARRLGPRVPIVSSVGAVADLVTGASDAYAAMAAASDPLAGLSDDDPMDFGRVAFMITALSWIGLHGAALQLATRLAAIARERSAPSMLPVLLAGMCTVHAATGGWDAGVATGTNAVHLAEETGQRGAGAWARCVLAQLHAARGEAGPAEQHAAAALVEETTARSIVFYAQGTMGLLALGAGDFQECIRRLGRALNQQQSAGMGSHVVLPYLPDLVEAAVRSDDRPLARRALGHLETLDPSGIPQTQAAVARCRGLLADDHTAAADLFRTAIAVEDAAGLPFEAARSRLLLGERLLRTRTRADAREPLERAFATFDRLGAAPWADRAASALGTLRARPSRADQPTAELTPQELQVAHAAAQGLTNKQIAAQLFLSVKTVEFHLRNAYGKLGVRSRTQLTLRLRPAGTPATDAGAS